MAQTPTPDSDGKIDVIEMMRDKLKEAGNVTAAQHQLITDTAEMVERARAAHRSDLLTLLAELIGLGTKVATGEVEAQDFAGPIDTVRKLIESIP